MRNGYGKAIGIIVALFVGVGTVCLAVESHRRDIETQREAQAARAVSTLPPGVEGAWLAYVDKQIARLITRRGETLELSDLTELSDLATIVSINTPFRISCDPMLGATITFGYGETSASVEIIDVMMGSAQDTESAPDLPVDVGSVAAHKLAAELCERISERIQALVRPSVAGGE